MSHGNTTELTGATFGAEALGKGVTALVDFNAEWCQPCRLLAPTIDALARRFGDRVVVGAVNVDSEPELATRYGISSIPTVILFRDGEPVKRWVGLHGAEDYAAAIESASESAA